MCTLERLENRAGGLEQRQRKWLGNRIGRIV